MLSRCLVGEDLVFTCIGVNRISLLAVNSKKVEIEEQSSLALWMKSIISSLMLQRLSSPG